MEIVEALKQTVAGEMLITFVVAMLPVVELRGSIPLGVSLGLGHWLTLAVSIVGNMVPSPFIIIFIRRIFAWLRKKSVKLGRFIDRLENSTSDKQELVNGIRSSGSSSWSPSPCRARGRGQAPWSPRS